MGFLKTLTRIIQRYRELDGLNLSAALSFYTIISILPILLLMIAFLGHFVGESEVLLQKVGDFLDIIVPNLKEGFLINLRAVVDKRGAFGWFGIFLLIFGAHFLFANLERTINKLLGTHEKRHFLITRFFFIPWIIGIFLLLMLPSILDLVQETMAQWGLPSLHLGLSGNQLFFLAALFSFLMLILLLPEKKVGFRNALLGGLIFSVFLQLARILFHYYAMNYFSRYNLVYGSLTTLILGAIWVFYFSNILILSVLWVGEKSANKSQNSF